MEQHSVPRQITTFEFKLIGFMTLRQFLYLLVFSPIALVVYYLFPIPFLNIVFAFLVGGVGLIFAFVPIYDRPVDVWIKNLYRRLTKPTQFLYKKINRPIYFLNNLFFVSDPHRTTAHVESQEKLNAYLAGANKVKTKDNQINKRKQIISSLFKSHINPPGTTTKEKQVIKQGAVNKKLPFFTGVIKNHKLIALPGVLVYVKDVKNQTQRLLKTNPHGVFATFRPLPAGEYFFETKDPNKNYFFDTIKVKIEAVNQKPIEIFSKELI